MRSIDSEAFFAAQLGARNVTSRVCVTRVFRSVCDTLQKYR